jgi:tight adherence protein B
LPDALHALSAALRSGVSLPKGLEQLASWQPAPLSQEFGLVLSEYQIGRDLGDALDNMYGRIGGAELELMNGAIKISRAVGGNLADTLESLAVTLAEKLSVEGKIAALTAMGKLQGWVVSLVPLLVGVALYLLDPAQIEPLFTELHGWITLGIITVLMTLAVFMIRKIVNIDV